MVFSISTYLRKLLRWWKEEVLTRISVNISESRYYSRRDMVTKGQMIEPETGQVERYIYKEIRN